jgi:methyl-accepting chemotaxis protein
MDTSRRFMVRDVATDDERLLAERINLIVGRLNLDLRELARLSNEMSTAAASNSFLLTRIAEAARDQSEQTEALATAFEQTARGSETVARSAGRTRELTQQLVARSATSFTAMERALAHLADLSTGAEENAQMITEVAKYSEQIASLVDVIDDISTSTNLLGINAAIEAAHAGDAGRGFGVVADEIKKLADSTRASTKQIAQTIKEVQRAVERATDSSRSGAQRARDVSSEAQSARDDLARMKEVIAASTDQVNAIAATVEEQSTTLQSVSETVKVLSSQAHRAAQDTSKATELHLDELNRATFEIIGRYELGTFLDKVKALAVSVASDVETAIAGLLARGTLTTSSIFDTQYVELRGADMQRLSKLFDISRAHVAGFVPPKYRTAWDAALDDALLGIVDRAVAALPQIEYACIVDINGFLTMHAKKYREPITGDNARDLTGNRVKRIFDDPTGIRAARVGLENAIDRVPKRASRSAFREGGVRLDQHSAIRPFVLQSYARDTGMVLNDFATAIFVRGEHWGAVRIAFDPKL